MSTNIQMDKNLRDNVMRRVLFIYGLKQLPRVFLPKFTMLASLVAVAGFIVSVPNVFKNMPSVLQLPKFFEFITSAFLNTEFTTQAIALGSLVVLMYMFRDVVRTFQVRTQALNIA